MLFDTENRLTNFEIYSEKKYLFEFNLGNVLISKRLHIYFPSVSENIIYKYVPKPLFKKGREIKPPYSLTLCSAAITVMYLGL